ncbi:hypothetical protein CRI93_02715 [Longimonas halophila]|uniref:GHMP kinase N-terminal domain-containing protein n=1 Tax=Longimonas halophila TaxID=1469170 RepID=A0A2H3NVF0_9BACT|nr:hypothetical protein [Longimonas halophila]PEN08687.1 hypothetical protein CRI93_02715 [Longimonas halophila]
MHETTVRAPAKLILMGEHAVVYQRPALVAALGLWMHATAAPKTTAGVTLQVDAWGHTETTTWPAIRAYADEMRSRWRDYAAYPTAEAFAHLRSTDPTHLIKVALGEAARAVDITPQPLTLSVQSDQPVGAGFGSSAALGVAVARAYLEAHEAPFTHDLLFDIALNIERRQHGTPSGVDPATILRGGLLWAESDNDALHWHSVEARAPVLSDIRIFHTGAPNESTGTVVDAVRARRTDDPDAFEAIIDRIEAATRALRDLLSAPDVSPSALVDLLQEGEACLEALGVVPPAIRHHIRQIEAHGGAAKISGAGALTDPHAGSLIAYHPDPTTDLWDDLSSFSSFNVPLCVQGAHPLQSAHVHG